MSSQFRIAAVIAAFLVSPGVLSAEKQTKNPKAKPKKQVVAPRPLPAQPTPEAPLPLVVKKLLDQPGIRFIERFPGPAGLIGYALQNELEVRVVYTLANGKTLFVGGLMDEAGAQLTEAAELKYADKLDLGSYWASKPPVAEPLQSMFKAIVPTMSTATLGKGKSEVYAFYDGFCGYCAAMVDQLYGLGDVAIQIVPVARQHPDSEKFAAAMLEGEDKNFTMGLLMGKESREVAFSRYQTVSEETSTAIAKNQAAMDQLQIRGTPSLVWKGEDGLFRMHPGFAGDKAMKALLSRYGSPE